MASGKHNYIFEQGVSEERVVTWNDDAGDPIDNTGYTAAMQVRRQFDSASTILSLVSPTNITVGGADGTFTITVTSAVMAGLDAGKFRYDFEVTSAGGIVTRLLEGAFTVTAEVTR